MNTSLVISLDTRRAKKDGTFPLIMRLTHKGNSTSIPIGRSILTEHWDENARVVKKSYPGNATRLNNSIQKTKSEALDIILKTDTETLSINALKEKLVSGGSQSFFTFTQALINDFVHAGRVGNARCYKGVAAILKTFTGGELKFDQITYPFLMRFETNHLSKGNTVNSLSVYMRTIRSIYNKAIKEGVADKDKYPFHDYKIRQEPTKKRAIDMEYIRRIIELDIPPKHRLFHTRNFFLASFMMYGMNFIDMAHLKRTDMVDGRIIYRRSKTKKIYDIKITPWLETIFNFYEGDYIFPIIKRDTPSLQEKDIMWARKGYNKRLKKLAVLCGIDAHLTSYVSRHSFATQAMMQQVPLNAISTMLGHSSLKTTEVYLKGLPSNVLDNYNAQLLGIE